MPSCGIPQQTGTAISISDQRQEPATAVSNQQSPSPFQGGKPPPMLPRGAMLMVPSEWFEENG